MDGSNKSEDVQPPKTGQLTRIMKPAKVTSKRIFNKDPKTLNLELTQKTSATFEPHDRSEQARPMEVDKLNDADLKTLPPGVYRIKKVRRKNKVKLVRSVDIEVKCPIDPDVKPCDLIPRDQ